MNEESLRDQGAAESVCQLTLYNSPLILSGQQWKFHHDHGTILLSQVSEDALEIAFKVCEWPTSQKVIAAQFDDDQSGKVIGRTDCPESILCRGSGLREVVHLDVVLVS